MNNFAKRVLCFLCFFCSLALLYAQAPANDNCENADEIKISGNGFDFGIFKSAKFKVDDAGRQKGEQCAKELEDNGNCDKTVWFKFYIPTTRNISVKLTQKDSAIPQIFAGFNVYSIGNCDYGREDLALNLSPLNKFGESGNSCLSQGWYFIQVGCKQKAKGEVWIELTCAVQSVQLYDNFSQPYDFGIVKDKEVSVDLITTCASVEAQEALAIGDSSFSKSVFCKFTLPANAVYNLVQFYPGSYDRANFRYRVFRNSMTQDSVNGNKPFQTMNANGYAILVKEYCPDNKNADATYYVQVIASNPSSTYCQLRVANYTYKADAWNTPATNDIIATKNGFSRTIDHYTNCEGRLNKHICKSVIPDSFNYYRKDYKGDTITTTFKIGGYTILNVSENGAITVSCKDANNYTATLFYSIYKGDITKGCNLTQVGSAYVQNFNFCVEPGAYTLVTALELDLAFGLLKHSVKQDKPSLNTVHYHPGDPEDMGVFTPSLNKIKRSSGINFNLGRDTVIKIDTLSLKGDFIFRELYLSEKAAGATISESNYSLVDLYVVKGRMSKGNAHLLNGYIYRGGYYFQMANCVRLDTGYYTIISRIDSLKKPPSCFSPLSTLTIYPPPYCGTITYNEVNKAYAINNMSDVLGATANKSNLDYVFPLPYCSNCNTLTNGKPAFLQFKKQFLYPNTFYSFYTFYLGTNAELRLPYLDYNSFELYNGDGSLFPGIIKDTQNIVSPCISGNLYCNLKAGTYTLVVFNVSANLSAYFTPHRPSPNDYANKAYDFGHISTNGTKVSAPLPITCHTNAFNSDPCSMENGMKQCFRWSNDVIIPYKDTENVKRPYTRKNLWYTFTVDNSANITVTVSAKTPLHKNPKMNLYRYNGTFNSNFQTVLANQFDSTDKTMEWLATNTGYVSSSSDNRKDNFTFSNQGCATNRYFILLEEESTYDNAHYEYIITLNYTGQNLSNTGDFCQNPVTLNANSYSTNLISANNICHTYGNSPYETDYNRNIKSAWYRINITNLKNCDIRIRNTKGNGLLYYNIYGGSCSSITKVVHLSDVFSYFTLSCMGPGSYFIQAVCQNTVNADIEFEVTTLLPSNPNCKPYDFRIPIAQFKMDGGCNNDTLKLINISSTGAAITYAWYINKDFLSSDMNVKLMTSDPKIRPKNLIKLVVTNTADNFSDTVTQSFEPDTASYKFKIEGPEFARCNDTVMLKVNTNFPDRINYTWTQQNNTTPVFTKYKMVYYPGYDTKYYVKGESDNCKFSDSFTLKLMRSLHRYSDTSLCTEEGYTIYPKKGEYLFVGDQQVKDSFRMKTSGNYFIRYTDKSCQYYDSISVEIDTGVTVFVQRDSIYACMSPLKLTYPYGRLKKYLWSTGDSVSEILVMNSGNYTLKGRKSECRLIDYSVNLKIEVLNQDILQNREVCKGDTVSFINPYPQFKIALKEPQQDKIVGSRSFREKMILKKGLCTISDSADINVYSASGLQIDSTYCDPEVFPVTLDAGFASKYLWLYDKSTGRYADVPGFGKYQVLVSGSHTCPDTLIFNVYQDCPLVVFIPDVFSPNGDLYNELFGPVLSAEIKKYRLQVFNRWGEKLFDEVNRGWNGKYLDEFVQQGVYLYLLDVYDRHNKATYFRGTFTLLR